MTNNRIKGKKNLLYILRDRPANIFLMYVFKEKFVWSVCSKDSVKTIIIREIYGTLPKLFFFKHHRFIF